MRRLNLLGTEEYIRVLVCRNFEKIFTGVSTPANNRNMQIICGPSSSPNASINGSNCDMMQLHDWPCVNQRVTADFRIFSGINLCAPWAFSKMACFIQLNLNVFHSEMSTQSNS